MRRRRATRPPSSRGKLLAVKGQAAEKSADASSSAPSRAKGQTASWSPIGSQKRHRGGRSRAWPRPVSGGATDKASMGQAARQASVPEPAPRWGVEHAHPDQPQRNHRRATTQPAMAPGTLNADGEERRRPGRWTNVRRDYWNQLRQLGDRDARPPIQSWSLLKRPENLNDNQARTLRRLRAAGGEVWRALQPTRATTVTSSHLHPCRENLFCLA